jgi:putative exporter of polyketide antibiotics
VSTTPDPQPDGAEPADVDDAQIRELVDPGSVRRAPRYKGFMVAGVTLGIVIGTAVGLFMLATYDPSRDQPLTKPGVWFTVTVLGTTTATTLLAGLLATILDRRSLKRWNAQQDAGRGV